MTVRQLLRSLDSAELTEWLAYWQLEQERDAPPAADIPGSLKKAFGA